MKKILMLVQLTLISLFVSCASPGFGPIGGIFTEAKMGIYGTSPTGSKIGESCTKSYLGIYATGDSSVETSANNAGIKKINNINLKTFSILGVYAKLCTEVQGD